MWRPARLVAVVLLLSIVAMLGIAIAMAPARFIGGLLPEPVARATFDWRGTLWRGSVALDPPLDWLAKRDAGHLAWRVTAVQPLAGRAIVDAGLRGPLHMLRGRAELTRREQSVTDVRGNVDLALLAPLLERYDIVVGGLLKVNDLTVIHDRQGVAVTAGRLHWAGGPVQFRLTGDWQTRRLPALDAEVASRNDLSIVDAAGAPLIDLTLRGDGWVKVAVRRHLLDLLAVPWPGSDAPEKVVVVLEERLI